MVTGLGVYIGEFNEDGSLKTDVTECALSHTVVKGIHAVQVYIKGTPYFYRVKTDVWHRFSDEWRAAFEQPYTKAAKSVRVEKEVKPDDRV
jgi:hypothetical protein